jgi:flavin reductase (DIM6/NTAB) family NADH-FMN oxidoreductase RutF
MAESVQAADPAQFKRALGLWASGVTVVTTRTNGRIYCMTASSFSSLSIDPLLIIICVARSAKLHELLEPGGAFAVNVLREDQRALGEAYARSGREPVEQLDLIDTFDGPSGSPIFSPCLAYLDCRIHRIYDGGDHSIVVGEVLAAGSDESAMPLIYFNRSYRSVRDLEY